VAGSKANPDWISAHTEMVREGMIWVGVSAQYLGVGRRRSGGLLNIALKTGNPERYGARSRTGRQLLCTTSVRRQGRRCACRPRTNPLGELPIERVIAIGESHPPSACTDVHQRPLPPAGPGIRRVSGAQPGAAAVPPCRRIRCPAHWARPDVHPHGSHVPVLTFQTETDLITLD
jgi:hypothetical protein